MIGVEMSRHALACILPPDLLVRVAQDATLDERSAILRSLELDHSFRSHAQKRPPGRASVR